jgi:hypothetical protein
LSVLSKTKRTVVARQIRELSHSLSQSEAGVRSPVEFERMAEQALAPISEPGVGLSCPKVRLCSAHVPGPVASPEIIDTQRASTKRNNLKQSACHAQIFQEVHHPIRIDSVRVETQSCHDTVDGKHSRSYPSLKGNDEKSPPTISITIAAT